MNLDTAKKLVFEQKEKKHHFVYIGSRNQIEEFDGKIIELYPSIFLIELDNGMIKSFTYSDYVIRTIRIIS